MYPRNAASPEPIAIGQVVQISDGAIQTSGVTVRIKPVGVAEANGAGTTAYSTDGVVLYTPTQAETDYTSFALIASKAGCFAASQTVITSASNSAGYTGIDWGKVTGGSASVSLPNTIVGRVTLVDTTTTNSDMRGTDNALLAASYTAPLTTAGTAAAVWNALLATYTTADSFGARVMRLDHVSSGNGVKVTGAGHVASDIHELQDGVITAAKFSADAITNVVLADSAINEIRTGIRTELATELGRIDVTLSSRLAFLSYTAPDNASIADVKAVTDKLNSGLVADGASYQFTANMLELAPAGGGGGGSGDATLANQVLILQSLNDIKGTGFTSSDDLVHLHDSINAAINSILTQSTPAVGSIVGFPATLHIGDSYTAATGNAIVVYLRDADNNPILGMGSKLFSAPDFRPSLVVSQANNVGRVEAVVSYQTPGGGAEPYLRVEIPSHQSRRGYAGMATMQCTLRWDGYQVTLATQPVEWIPQI